MNVFYSFPLRIGVTGTGMTAWHQVAGVSDKGVNVFLSCGSCERPFDDLADMKETLKPLGFRLPIRLLGCNNAMMLHDRMTAAYLRKIHRSRKIDVVHCWPSGSLTTLYAAKELGITTFLERPSAHTRYVFNIVERESKKLGIQLAKSHYATRDLRRLAREEEEFAVADFLLCPSDFVCHTFRRTGFADDKLLRHQYGYDRSVFHNHSTAGSRDGRFKVAYVGDCSPLKGLHFALEAWFSSNACRNGKLYVCGGIAPGYAKVVEKYLKEPSIEFMGFVPNVAGVMQSCDAMVLPSLAEGSALVTYEARACGCVLLVSNASGAVCEHMVNGIVHEAGNVAMLTKHINALYEDVALRERLRKNSLVGINELTWDKAGEKLANLYKTCCI